MPTRAAALIGVRDVMSRTTAMVRAIDEGRLGYEALR